MHALIEFILAPPSISDRGLALHLLVKTLIFTTILVVLWITRAQAAVVYEAF